MNSIIEQIESEYSLEEFEKQAIQEDILRLRELILHLGLSNDDKRLVISHPTKYRWAVSINKRYVYTLVVRNEVVGHGFILPRNYYQDVVSKRVGVRKSDFSGDKVGIVSPVYCGFTVDTDIASLPEFFDQWFTQCHIELTRGTASPWKKSHSPDLYDEIVNGTKGDDISSVDNFIKIDNISGAGFGSSEQNREVELSGMKHVAEYYHAEGYQVLDISKENRGYDLFAFKETEEVHIEVKGAKGSGRQFFITSNELRCMRTDERFVVALVNNALTEKPIITILNPNEIPESAVSPIIYRVNLDSISK